MSIETSYLDNTPIKDLDLSMTSEQLNDLNKLDDESKKILSVDALLSNNLAAEEANIVVGSTDATVSADQAVQQPPTTTLSPTQILTAVRNHVNSTDPFAPYQETLDPRKTPLSEIKRYDDSGFQIGKTIGPGFVYGRDNEDYAAKNEGFWTNLGKGLVRLPVATGIKIGQTTGFIAGLIDPTNWGDNYLENASNNAINNVFDQMDEKMKNDWLPVYEKAEAQDKGFWWKATHDMNFWTNDFVDGAAFMISAFAPGGLLARVGLGQRIAKGLSALKWGAEGANSAVEGAATAENYLINAQKVWANRIDKINQWALSVAGEAMFESTEVGDNIKKGLTYNEAGELKINPDTGLPYSEQEKRNIAGSHMKSSFLANAAILSVSNAMELKWINSMLGKSEGQVLSKGLFGGGTLGAELTFQLENQGISKLLNSKSGAFLKAAGLGIGTEGFYEENIQLAIQRINQTGGIQGKVAEFKDSGEMIKLWGKQAVGAITGKDTEASMSIGLGGILGGGMSGVSGMKKFKRNKAFTESAVKFYNESQQSFLKFGNIFETKTVTKKDENGKDVTSEEIVLDENGKPTINHGKLLNIANNFNNVNSAVDAANVSQNKFKRDLLRDSAWANFVQAHVQLGIENSIFIKLDAVGRTDPSQLVKLGFTADETTPAQIEKYKNLTRLIIKQNKLLNDDIIFETNWKGQMKPEEQARQHRMTELATQQAVYRNLLDELHTESVEFKNDMLKTVDGHVGLNDDFVDQLNTLQLKINSQRQYIEELGMGKASPVESAMAKTVLNDLTTEMEDLKKNNTETLKTLKKDTDGFYNYEKSVRNEPIQKLIRSSLYGRYARIGQINNHIKQVGLEWAKYADTKNGKKNFAEYIDNVITKPFSDALDRAERGKSSRLTDEERKQKRKDRKDKGYENTTPWVKKGTNATFLYRFEDDDRVGEDIMEYYDVQDGETVALKPLLEKLIANPYTDPYIKSIISKMLPRIGDDAKIKFDTQQTYAPAYYTVGTSTITIDPELHETKMSFEGVVLHELIHLVTSDELGFDSKFTRDIEQLYAYAKKNLEDRGIDTSYYGFTNIHEFLAEAYSNPEFQKELQSVPGKTGQGSIWQDFLEALNQFFKKTFNLEIKPSVLDDIFYKVEEYLGDTVYKEAVRQYKINGLTDEEIAVYSKRELIDMAIKDDLISPELLSQSRSYPEETSTEENNNQPGEITDDIDQDIEYTYKGQNYGLFVLGDEVNLINPTNPDDTFSFDIAVFKEMMRTGVIKEAAKAQPGVANTLEEHLQTAYNQAKTAAEASGRTIATYEDWKKTAGKFETQRYNRLKNIPEPGEVKTDFAVGDTVTYKNEPHTIVDISSAADGRIVYHLKDKDGKPIVDGSGIRVYVNAADISKPTAKEETDYAEQVKVNNEFIDSANNTYKIASIIPGRTVSYVKTTPQGVATVEKEPLDGFIKKLEDGTVSLQQTAFVEEDDDSNNVKDFVQNSRFDNSGLNNTTIDNNTANISFQEGRKQKSPHNALANTTDLVKFEMAGTQMRFVRLGVNNNYVFDIATGTFPKGSSIKYRVMTSDFPDVENRLTGETYNKSRIFDENGKVRQDMYDYAPIGVYAMIEGKEMLIGTVHEPQWISYKVGSQFINMVVPEDELDQPMPNTVKKELVLNMKLRSFILDNHNLNPKFEMNGIVESKSIGVLRTLAQPGTLKERLNPKIGEGGTDNRHGMFAIVRNGELQVSRNITIDGVEDTKSFTENIDNQSGVPVILVPTPKGTFFPAYIKLPNVNEGQAAFIIEAWKAFTNQAQNPELVKAVYDAVGVSVSAGKPDIGVLQNYIDHYITILDKTPLSSIGTGADVSSNVARLNINNDGHLYIQSKLGDQWFDNGGKPIVTENQLPSDIMSHLQNLLTTVKFTNAKNKKLAGINSTVKVPFVTMENGKMKITPMTYNQYIMERASTYIEEGINSKNKNGDWVYFANPVIKMSSNTENIVIPPLVETEVCDTFEESPVIIPGTETNVSGQIFDLFPQSETFGKLSKEANRTRLFEKDGIGFAEYTNPDTGTVDIYLSAFSDSDFIGYIRVYENGKPTNRFTSKLERRTDKPGATKLMVSELQKMLPDGHEFAEDISVSTDGIKFFANQLKQGYEVLKDKNGNIVTTRIAINGESKVNDLGVNIPQADNFNSLPLLNKKDFEKVKAILTERLKEFGITNANIQHQTKGGAMTAVFDFPVLVKSKSGSPIVSNITEKQRVAKIYEELNSGNKMIFDLTQEELTLIEKYDENLNLKTKQPTAEASLTELDKLINEGARLANVRSNDKVVRKAIMDFNKGNITIEELDAAFKKWDDANGLTEIDKAIDAERKKQAGPATTASTSAVEEQRAEAIAKIYGLYNQAYQMQKELAEKGKKLDPDGDLSYVLVLKDPIAYLQKDISNFKTSIESAKKRVEDSKSSREELLSKKDKMNASDFQKALTKIDDSIKSDEKFINDYTKAIAENEQLVKDIKALDGGTSAQTEAPVETDLDDIFATLTRTAAANELTDEQIQEEKNKCIPK